MGKSIASDERWGSIRDRIVERLLPDVCTIYPPDRKTMTAGGSYTYIKAAPVTYKGVTEIPCRLDISRNFRSANIFEQEVLTNDFELHVPWDATIKADYKIVKDGKTYEIRKLLDTHTWNATKIALVIRIDAGTGNL